MRPSSLSISRRMHRQFHSQCRLPASPSTSASLIWTAIRCTVHSCEHGGCGLGG
eukprot:m.551106 g.551106  ORF g.551106 m.551106 type:complete len:54 (+) comp57731_c0_seq63:750-911(+)